MQLGAVLLCALVATAAAASTSSPGGLDRSETPQFVLLTHDDSIAKATASAMLALTSGKSANGCPIAATMFALADSDWGSCRDLYDQGYEIAVHSLQHKSLLRLPKAGIQQQLSEGRSQIASKCGISEGQVVGHRSPYLETKPEVREVLAELGYEYDSTLITSTKASSMGSRIWPFDLGAGIQTTCSYYANIQKCNDGESYPGLKEVPLWDLTAQGGTFTMDYGDDPDGSGITGGDVLSILMANFEDSYAGNRAPFPLFTHTPYIQRNTAALARFIDEVSSRPGVYFVTMRQLLAWMERPVGLSQLTPEALGCGNAGGAPGSGEASAATPRPPSPSPSPAADQQQPQEEEAGSPAPPPPPPKKKKRKHPPPPPVDAIDATQTTQTTSDSGSAPEFPYWLGF